MIILGAMLLFSFGLIFVLARKLINANENAVATLSDTVAQAIKEERARRLADQEQKAKEERESVHTKTDDELEREINK